MWLWRALTAATRLAWPRASWRPARRLDELTWPPGGVHVAMLPLDGTDHGPVPAPREAP